MSFEIHCSSCGKPSSNLLDFRCPSCGKPLDVEITDEFSAQHIERTSSVWRYLSFFPYIKKNDIVTLGEGLTPLVKLSDNVYVKLDNLNPTGSFKDRGSTTLVSALHRIIKKANACISEDSSGNAGASMAAYAARAKLRTKIYVPETVSGPKFKQIQFYGAEVARIAGDRAKVAEEAQKPEPGKIYVGHILHPLFRDGIRSIAYEIAEQLQWKTLVTIYLPVSAGTLLLGVLSGLRHMFESGAIKYMPKVIACQTEQVSPLYHRFLSLPYLPPLKVASVADALVSTNPPFLDMMTGKLKEANGDVAIVNENDVCIAFRQLARNGFFVEPSSAVAYAAFKNRAREKRTFGDEKAIVVLTGSGLKTTLKPS